MDKKQIVSFLKSYLSLTLTTYPLLLDSARYLHLSGDEGILVSVFNKSVEKNNIRATASKFVTNMLGDKAFTSAAIMSREQMTNSFILMYKSALSAATKSKNQAIKDASSVSAQQSTNVDTSMTVSKPSLNNDTDSLNTDINTVIGMIGVSYGFSDFIKDLSVRIDQDMSKGAAENDTVISLAREFYSQMSL